MSLFKRRRFPIDVILLCVRWYKYGTSYRDIAEMMQMSRPNVFINFPAGADYAPKIEKRVRHFEGPRSGSWWIDPTPEHLPILPKALGKMAAVRLPRRARVERLFSNAVT